MDVRVSTRTADHTSHLPPPPQLPAGPPHGFTKPRRLAATVTAVTQQLVSTLTYWGAALPTSQAHSPNIARRHA
jgi:hypothetical protein